MARSKRRFLGRTHWKFLWKYCLAFLLRFPGTGPMVLCLLFRYRTDIQSNHARRPPVEGAFFVSQAMPQVSLGGGLSLTLHLPVLMMFHDDRDLGCPLGSSVGVALWCIVVSS